MTRTSRHPVRWGLIFAGRRFPFERGRWPSSIAIYLAICLTSVFLLDLAYAYHISNLLPPPPNPTPVFTRAVQFFVVWVLSDGLLYWTILSVSYAVEHYRISKPRLAGFSNRFVARLAPFVAQSFPATHSPDNIRDGGNDRPQP
jgi:hypothetical protein